MAVSTEKGMCILGRDVVCFWATEGRFQCGHYERMTGKGWIGKDLKGTDSELNEVASRNLPGRTDGKPRVTSLIVFLVSWGGVRLSPLRTSATKWPIVPAPDDRWWLWSNRWNENWQGKPKYSEKTCPMPLCPPQIPHDVTWARTWAAIVGSRRLTAWAIARPTSLTAGNTVEPKSRTLCRDQPARWCRGAWQTVTATSEEGDSAIPRAAGTQERHIPEDSKQSYASSLSQLLLQFPTTRLLSRIYLFSTLRIQVFMATEHVRSKVSQE
jgi:hypothetical protein